MWGFGLRKNLTSEGVKDGVGFGGWPSGCTAARLQGATANRQPPTANPQNPTPKSLTPIPKPHAAPNQVIAMALLRRAIARFGFEFRATGSGFGVTGRGFRVPGFGLWDPGSEFRVSGFGIWVSGFGIRVSGFGGRPSGCNGVRRQGGAPSARKLGAPAERDWYLVAEQSALAPHLDLLPYALC